jgi:hypothetical protein
MEKEPEPRFSDALTLSELNIHMGYIRERIVLNNVERTRDLQEIKETLKVVSQNQITPMQFQNLVDTVKVHDVTLKTLVEFKDTLNGKLWGVGILATAIGFFLNLIFK